MGPDKQVSDHAKAGNNALSFALLREHKLLQEHLCIAKKNKDCLLDTVVHRLQTFTVHHSKLPKSVMKRQIDL